MTRNNQKSDGSIPPIDPFSVAGAVHDMNQLFGVIMGRTGSLLEANPGPLEKRNLEAILLAAKDAAVLAQRLLGPAPSTEQEILPTAMDQLVAQAILLSATDEDRRKWPVEIGIPPGLFSTIPAQVIREILNNLLRNAQAAMPDGGSLSIKAQLSNDHISLLVQDRGPGLDADTASRIFEVGFSTSGNASRGIGLPASRLLAQSHGGGLSFIPSSDRGALFELIVPLGDGLSAATINATELSEHAAVPDSQQMIPVLVVDDDRAMRDMLADVLPTMGCTVVTAMDSASALDVMATNNFHISFLDQNLPGMKGLDLAVELRKLDPLQTRILITGWGNENIDPDLSEAAVDLVARKPLEFGSMRDLIGQGLSIRNEKIKLHPKESGQ